MMIFPVSLINGDYLQYPKDHKEYFLNPFTGERTKNLLGFIGIKPDAPQWAKDEYKNWVEARKEAKKEGLK